MFTSIRIYVYIWVPWAHVHNTCVGKEARFANGIHDGYMRVIEALLLAKGVDITDDVAHVAPVQSPAGAPAAPPPAAAAQVCK